MTAYTQLGMFELATVLAVETRFHATLTPQRNAGVSAPATPAERTQPQHAGRACPLCRGAMDGSTCTRCGMEVEL